MYKRQGPGGRDHGLAAQGPGDRPRHGGDGVAVPAVVDRTEHRGLVPPVRDEQHPQRDRELLDGMEAGGTSGAERRVAVVRPDRVVRGHRRPQRCQRRLEVPVAGGHVADGRDRVARAVLGQGQGRVHHRGGRRPRHARGRHRRREHACRLPSVRGLVRTGDVQRLRVRARRIARVGDAHRRHVHRRAAVDDVAAAGLAGVGVRVVQPGHDPLLGEEDPLQRQCLGLQLRDPAGGGHQVGDQVLGDRVGVEVVPYGLVDPYQRVRHQGVVRDVPVALVVRRDGAGRAPVLVPGADDAVHAAAVPFHDLVRGPALHRAAERVADGGSDESAAGPVLQRERHVRIIPWVR